MCGVVFPYHLIPYFAAGGAGVLWLFLFIYLSVD